MADARMYGVELRKRLDTAIRQLILPPLGLELGHWAQVRGRKVADDAERHELEAAALTFVFRSLFLLYAESAGYLPMARDAYARGSLTQVVRDAWEQRDGFDGRSTKFWDRTQTLVRAMRNGDNALGVPPYNGDLFASDGFDGAAVLEVASLPDTAAGPALSGFGEVDELLDAIAPSHPHDQPRTPPGIALVNLLADRWGYQTKPGECRVWFELDLIPGRRAWRGREPIQPH